MAKRTNDLGKDPVPQLLRRLALPAVTAQVVNALYNIVDRMYLGHMKPDGDMAITGVGVTFAVIMFISALSALVGMGGGSRAAIRTGEGRTDLAEEILGNCTLLILIISVVVMAVFLPLQRPMLLLMGASEETIGYAVDYLTIYLWGTVFVQIALALNNFITTQGFSTTSMLTVVIGAVINIVLDPIFIFGFDMGVRGAALATIIAQAVSAVWVLAFLTGKRTRLKIRLKYLRLKPKILLPVVAIGVSPFIMQSTESLVNIAFNSSLLKYGGNKFVGAMTICSSIMQVLTMIFQGLAQGAQPIVGYNYGSGQLDRVRKTFRLLITAGIIYSVAGCLLVELFPHAFVAMFNDKPELVEAAVWALRIYLACFFMLGVQFSCQQTFVALGQAKVSLFLALLRKIILVIPLIYILPHIITGDQVFAVYLAEPVADFLAAATTGLMFAWKFPRILRRREMELGKA
ncbi:MATE family efflux transporter [uncultured Pseudoflavonifractor sp.]|uniref:MATE family efflux transporter n=1 Tax=uncultured Pseudoflavonifractor sp. TaxID=1221379 RepID=UPI0025CDE1C3|nr:MATE family efflux transporter [uncultured Pseudoflavonifractor sp.]